MSELLLRLAGHGPCFVCGEMQFLAPHLGCTSRHGLNTAAQKVIAENRDLAAQLATLTQERDEYRTLAKVGTWHNQCRPNREMAARELEKSQAVINKLADRILVLEATVLCLRIALRNLVDRLDAVHANPQYQHVWAMYQIHGGDYTNGPKYDQELAAAKAALADLLRQEPGREP